MAYRASKQNFMETMLDETTKLLGRRPSQAERYAIAREFDDEATQYGLWEAGPEALSNLIMGKLLGPLGKRFFSGGAARPPSVPPGCTARNLPRKRSPRWDRGASRGRPRPARQCAGRVAGPWRNRSGDLLADNAHGRGKKGLDMLARRRAARRDERQTETDAVVGEEQGLPAAAQPPVRETDGQTAEPTTAVADGGMPDGWPVAEAAAGEVPARIAPETERMERGEHVDLLREDGGPQPAAEREKAHAAWARLVDAFQPENQPRGRQPKLMTVCNTPDVLQKLGAPDLPMTMSADNLPTNPAYRERFREWLRDEPGAERVKQGFLQVRDALDEAFVRAYNRMAGMAALAETDLELYRTAFGSLHNYFPHQRRGRYYVAAFRVGEMVFRKHFDVPPGSSVREEWAHIVAAHRKEHPGAHWAPPREAEKLPDDILGAPIDPQAMEQIIMAAARRLGGDAKQAAQVRETLFAGVADILKARGFGAHGIRRQHIPGFETEDIKGVLHACLAGLNGWLTKMDAAADFAQALGRIDAVKTPRLWEYASQYSKDMLRNSDRIDRITGNIKTVAFAWYLGGNIKTAVVNLTQNFIMGIPRLE